MGGELNREQMTLMLTNTSDTKLDYPEGKSPNEHKSSDLVHQHGKAVSSQPTPAVDDPTPLEDRVLDSDLTKFDAVINHPKRQHHPGQQRWMHIRGERRTPSREEAELLLNRFLAGEFTNLYGTCDVVDANGIIKSPRLLYKISPGVYRPVNLEEIIRNVGSKRASPSKKRKLEDGDGKSPEKEEKRKPLREVIIGYLKAHKMLAQGDIAKGKELEAELQRQLLRSLGLEDVQKKACVKEQQYKKLLEAERQKTQTLENNLRDAFRNQEILKSKLNEVQQQHEQEMHKRQAEFDRLVQKRHEEEYQRSALQATVQNLKLELKDSENVMNALQRQHEQEVRHLVAGQGGQQDTPQDPAQAAADQGIGSSRRPTPDHTRSHEKPDSVRGKDRVVSVDTISVDGDDKCCPDLKSEWEQIKSAKSQLDWDRADLIEDQKELLKEQNKVIVNIQLAELGKHRSDMRLRQREAIWAERESYYQKRIEELELSMPQQLRKKPKSSKERIGKAISRCKNEVSGPGSYVSASKRRRLNGLEMDTDEEEPIKPEKPMLVAEYQSARINSGESEQVASAEEENAGFWAAALISIKHKPELGLSFRGSNCGQRCC